MHKSGTTLVSKLLHSSNIHMGFFNEKQTYDSGNKYEMAEPLDINKSILNCHDVNSLFITAPFKDNLPDNYKNRINQIIKDKSNNYSNWGFKDPRTCLTYSVWKDELPKHKIIVVYRDISELWSHYKPKTFISLISRGIPKCWNAYNAWYIYNKCILEILQSISSNDYIIIKYSDLMTNDIEVKKLGLFVNQEIVDIRDKKLYRSKSTKDFYLFFVKKINQLLGHNYKIIMNTYKELTN